MSDRLRGQIREPQEATVWGDLLTALDVARLALRFGRVERATFHEDGVRPETDSDHTVMLLLLALELASTHPEWGLRIDRLMVLGLVHDLAEAEVGDTNTFAGLDSEAQQAKADRERRAIVTIRGVSRRIAEEMETYERQEEPEARFLRYLDKVLPRLTQALNGAAQARRSGYSVERLHARQREQGRELALEYPEWSDRIGRLFDAASRVVERELDLRLSQPVIPLVANSHETTHASEGVDDEVCRLTARVRELETAARWRHPSEDKWDLRFAEVRLKASPRVPIFAKRSISNDLGWMTCDGRMICDADILGWRPLGPGPKQEPAPNPASQHTNSGWVPTPDGHVRRIGPWELRVWHYDPLTDGEPGHASWWWSLCVSGVEESDVGVEGAPQTVLWINAARCESLDEGQKASFEALRDWIVKQAALWWKST